MRTIQLTLGEILLLKNEIYGSINPTNGEVLQKGLVNQNIPIKIKYWLNVLGEKVNYEDKIIKNLYDELGYKYGETDENGNLILNPSIKQEDGSFEINPNFLKFQSEYASLLQTLKELEYTPFLLSDIEQLTFEENYPTFNKLITNDKEV
jgi:hypothetical protein